MKISVSRTNRSYRIDSATAALLLEAFPEAFGRVANESTIPNKAAEYYPRRGINGEKSRIPIGDTVAVAAAADSGYEVRQAARVLDELITLGPMAEFENLRLGSGVNGETVKHILLAIVARLARGRYK